MASYSKFFNKKFAYLQKKQYLCRRKGFFNPNYLIKFNLN